MLYIIISIKYYLYVVKKKRYVVIDGKLFESVAESVKYLVGLVFQLCVNILRVWSLVLCSLNLIAGAWYAALSPLITVSTNHNPTYNPKSKRNHISDTRQYKYDPKMVINDKNGVRLARRKRLS